MDEGEPGVGLCKTSISLHNFSLKVHFIKITIMKQCLVIRDTIDLKGTYRYLATICFITKIHIYVKGV